MTETSVNFEGITEMWVMPKLRYHRSSEHDITGLYHAVCSCLKVLSVSF